MKYKTLESIFSAISIAAFVALMIYSYLPLWVMWALFAISLTAWFVSCVLTWIYRRELSISKWQIIYSFALTLFFGWVMHNKIESTKEVYELEQKADQEYEMELLDKLIKDLDKQ